MKQARPISFVRRAGKQRVNWFTSKVCGSGKVLKWGGSNSAVIMSRATCHKGFLRPEVIPADTWHIVKAERAVFPGVSLKLKLGDRQALAQDLVSPGVVGGALDGFKEAARFRNFPVSGVEGICPGSRERSWLESRRQWFNLERMLVLWRELLRAVAESGSGSEIEAALEVRA